VDVQVVPNIDLQRDVQLQATVNDKQGTLLNQKDFSLKTYSHQTY
jgi:hypothetical protein